MNTKYKYAISLIEIIVGIIILAIAFIATLGAISGFYRMDKELGYYYRAYNLAREPIEFIESFRMSNDWHDILRYDSARNSYSQSISFWYTNYFNQELQDLASGKLKTPSLLPPYPRSIYAEAYLLQNARILCVPEIVVPGQNSDAAPGSNLWLDNIKYAFSFVTWKNIFGRRKGIVLGVVPFRYYNGFSSSVSVRINKLSISTY